MRKIYVLKPPLFISWAFSLLKLFLSTKIMDKFVKIWDLGEIHALFDYDWDEIPILFNGSKNLRDIPFDADILVHYFGMLHQ